MTNNVQHVDQEYYEAMTKAADRAHEMLAKAHAKATARKAAGYAKVKAPQPQAELLPTVRVMRSVIRRPDLHASIPAQTRALNARAIPLASIPRPPTSYNDINVQLGRNRNLAAEVCMAGIQLNRGLKRRRDQADNNACTQAGNVAHEVTLFTAGVSLSLQNFLDEQGIPDV